MEKQEAFNVISQVCNSYKGTLQEHQAIQNALKLLTPEPVKEVKRPEIKMVDDKLKSK